MFVNADWDDEAYTHEAYQRYLKKFLRCVRGVDDNIGRLLEHLEKSGELDNTVIVYTADQGFMLGEHDYIDKRWMYEESLRMPFIVRYPAMIPAGTVNEDLVNNVDFAPTLLNIAGCKQMPDDFEGHSFFANVQGNTPADWRTATYYRYWMHMAHHDNPAHYGIRTRDHKLIFFYGCELKSKWLKNPDRRKDTTPYWELYDLRKDPHEMHNVYDADEYQDVVRQLKRKLRDIKKEIGDTDDKYPELTEIVKAYWN